MVNFTDVVIIAIALTAAFGALLLFLSVLQPKAHSQDSQEIRKMRLSAEVAQERIAEILNTVQHGAHDADYLTRQMKDNIEQVKRDTEASRLRAEEAELTVSRAKSAEEELRAISGQLGERVQHVQTYWDQQLGNTVETVRNVQKKLTSGLSQVDDGLLRLREQEKMAQGFTQKLVEHQKSQFSAQQENARLATEINGQLQAMLQESTKSLLNMQQQQQRSDDLFQRFSTEIQDMERQAHEYFSGVFQTTDVARQEMTAGLEESRRHLTTLREHNEQGGSMSERIRYQFSQVENLPVDRLTKAVDITDEMCADLQTGLENARNLLKTLEAKTAQVIDEAEVDKKAGRKSDVQGDKAKNQNLFSLRAYR